MEDDDIEYDITFPSPRSTEEDIEEEEDGFEKIKQPKEPVAILLGWLGCQDKHLAKYGQIYERKGCITIRYTAPQEITFFNPNLLPDVARKLLQLLYDFNIEDNPILFHIFSNNGSYVYNAVCQLLASDKKFAKLEVYGVIIDSAPGKRRILKAAKAFAGGLRMNAFIKYIMTVGMLLYLIFTGIFHTIARLFVAAKNEGTDPHLLYERMSNNSGRWPELYLYSKQDTVVMYQDIEEIADHRRQLGVRVETMSWDDCSHVAIFKEHREAYMKVCWEFIDSCLDVYPSF